MSDLSVEIEKIPNSSIKAALLRGGIPNFGSAWLAADAGRSLGPSTGWQLGRLDDRFQLVAGAVPSDKNNAKLSAQDLGIASDRAYLSYTEMLGAQRQRSDSIDVV